MSDEVAMLGADENTDKSAASEMLIRVIHERYAHIAATAPAATKADLDVVNAYVQASSTIDALSDFSADPEVNAANERHLRWTIEHCGFDPNDLAG